MNAPASALRCSLIVAVSQSKSVGKDDTLAGEYATAESVSSCNRSPLRGGSHFQTFPSKGNLEILTQFGDLHYLSTHKYITQWISTTTDGRQSHSLSTQANPDGTFDSIIEMFSDDRIVPGETGQ
jgi:hypothetical protein